MSKTSTPNHASPADLGTRGHHRPGDRPGPRCDLRARPAFRENTDFTVTSRTKGETDARWIPAESPHAGRDRPHRRAAV